MSLFDGIENSDPQGEKFAYLEPGAYTLEIQRVQELNTRKGPAFVAEFRVLSSNNTAHKVGDAVSWYQKMVDKDIAFPAIKAFLLAALGCSREELDPVIRQLLGAACGPANVLMGRVVVDVATSVPKRNSPGLFTRHNFSAHRYAPGTEPPTLTALLGGAGAQVPPPPAPPPPSPPVAAAPSPWAHLPPQHQTPTHWWNAAANAWVAK